MAAGGVITLMDVPFSFHARDLKGLWRDQGVLVVDGVGVCVCECVLG